MRPARPSARRLQAFTPTAGVRTLVLGGRNLLYTEDLQQVLELNETADCIWRALAGDGSVEAAARALRALGLPPGEAASLAQDTAEQWMLAGHLAPRALDERLSESAERRLVLDELAVELRLPAGACEAFDAVFGHLQGRAAGAARPLTVLEHEGRFLFYLERRLVAAGGREGWIAQLKAIVTDLYCDAVENGYLTHGALLTDGESTLLLCGEPGAGKTTLALALAAAGWRYGGDDIVRIDPDGRVRGAPFAAAVKAGALPLLRRRWAQLRRLPAWARADGQQARYLLPPNRASPSPRPLTAVVTLARRPGASAGLTPLAPVDALGAIMQGAYARRWRMTGEALCALAGALEAAVCARLDYDDLGPAVQAIADMARDQAQAA
jgi:hypothetical protein